MLEPKKNQKFKLEMLYNPSDNAYWGQIHLCITRLMVTLEGVRLCCHNDQTGIKLEYESDYTTH